MEGSLAFFAVAAPGVEYLLGEELTELGIPKVEVQEGGVAFSGDTEWMMRVNLWSRIASRVLVRAAGFSAPNLRALAAGAAKVSWSSFLGPQHRIRVKATCHASRVYHSGAAAQRVMDAACRATGCSGITDLPAAEGGVDETSVLVRLDRDWCVISMDTSGEHLHRRAYRLETARAPLRENLAAAVLHLAGWDGTVPLLDPMCGSGTFPVEAALLAAGRPPGLNRRFAFMDFPGFEQPLWERILGEAAGRVRSVNVAIQGADRDAGAVAIAQRNAQRAGVLQCIEIAHRPVFRTPLDLWGDGGGLMVCNPPYGKRIGEKKQLRDLYAAFGAVARRLPRCRVALVTPDPQLARATGLSFEGTGHPVLHGGIRIRVFLSDVAGA